MDGWIKLHRKINEWEWFTDVPTCHLFLFLLTNANLKEAKFRNENIPPGSLVCGRKSLSIKTGLSEQQIRTALDKLRSTNEITIKTTNKFSIISITNWKNYQSGNQQNNQQITNNQPTNNQQITTIEEGKKERRKESKKQHARADAPVEQKPDWIEICRKFFAVFNLNADSALVRGKTFPEIMEWIEEGFSAEEIISAAERIKETRSLPEMKNPVAYLKDAVPMVAAEIREENNPDNVKHNGFRISEWRVLLKAYADGVVYTSWNKMPHPDDPGCRAPIELLEEYGFRKPKESA